MSPKSKLVSLTTLALVELVSACGNGDQQCPAGCPSLGSGLNIEVTSPTPDVLSDVRIAFSGIADGELSCELYPSVAVCFWPSRIAPGIYSLTVMGSGFPTASVKAEVTTVPDSHCGCDSLQVTPDKVTLPQ